jgi:hypothetical protein
MVVLPSKLNEGRHYKAPGARSRMTATPPFLLETPQLGAAAA